MLEYRQLGRSGLRVSKLCLGTMSGFGKANEKEAAAIVYEAIDSGVNFVDTADVYGDSEESVGKILADGNRREKVVLATKFGFYMGKGANDYGAGRAHIINACEASLRKLRTDYIDLYILHVVDPNPPMEETLRALDLLVKQGKVRYIGTSKHPVLLLMEALAISEREGLERFVSEQPPYNLLDRTPEHDLIPMALRHGVAITPYVPLARGILAGAYTLGEPGPEGHRFKGKKPGDNNIFTVEAVKAVDKLRPLASDKGVTVAEFSLAWLMNQPGVTAPVLGAWKIEYLRSALKACDVKFTEEELAKVDEIVPPGTCVSDFYATNVHRPLMGRYAAGTPGTGAYIPAQETVQPKPSE